MQLISVNIGVERELDNGKSGKTGIFKQPTSQPVQITELGLTGDVIIDTENHGGVGQAVYIFGQTDYEWWSAHIEQDLNAGTFGENLTISDLESATLNIGDRLQVGDAVLLQVTAPRIPCSTLNTRMNDSQFIKKFKAAERPGVYCRVLQTGTVQAGDSVKLIPYQGDTISAITMFRWFYEKPLTETQLQQLVQAPIDVRSKAHYQKLLDERAATP